MAHIARPIKAAMSTVSKMSKLTKNVFSYSGCAPIDDLDAPVFYAAMLVISAVIWFCHPQSPLIQ